MLQHVRLASANRAANACAGPPAPLPRSRIFACGRHASTSVSSVSHMSFWYRATATDVCVPGVPYTP